MRIQWLLVLGALSLASAPSRAERQANAAGDLARFEIASGPLAEALDRFGDQSGLQIVYEPSLIADRNAAAVSGHMQRREALDRLLAGSGLGWKQVNDITVMLVVLAPTRSVPGREVADDSNPVAGHSEVFTLGDVQVSADPL